MTRHPTRRRFVQSLAAGSLLMPAYHQGMRVIPGKEPIVDLDRRTPQEKVQQLELGLAAALNSRHLHQRGNDPELAARIRTFETAFHMQTEAREAFDLSHETQETQALYGLNEKSTETFGWKCLVARRLAERGVRFIELIDGSTDELGATVAENRVHVHDFHATILHLLGIDHTRLTYRHAGRDFRLTDVAGRVVQDVLA